MTYQRLKDLTEVGTSIWLDQLRWGMVAGGTLGQMIEDCELRGVTSNPAIFEKSMLESSDYDDELINAVEAGLDAVDIYERLAIRDVKAAAKVMEPVYEQTNHLDGYVSLEVAPDLANRTDETIAQAKRYWETVDCPNLMVKIPGTEAGIPAIEECLYCGININVTLLFSVAMYEQVMETYISAMERRHAEGLSLDVHSVASFFVSRVDTEADKRLKQSGNKELLGTAGLANARAAYLAYKRVFEGARFTDLREAGCPVQRPLWASTGVKDPAYSDTLYVDGLVGRDTVNTMPLATLEAARDHSVIKANTAEINPEPQIKALADAGIDLDDVANSLLTEGIDKFTEPMGKLIEGIDARRRAILATADNPINFELGDTFEAFDGCRQRVEKDSVADRFWAKDATLWGPKGTPEVDDRISWIDAPKKLDALIAQLAVFVESCRKDGLKHAVVLGMGGSSLAPDVFSKIFAVEGALELLVLDSTDPCEIASVESKIELDRTLFIVSSKSGGTLETLSLFRYFHKLQPNGKQFVAITDPGSELEQIAKDHDFRKVFAGDPEIGGRYSALSAFGLVPAALGGVNLDVLAYRANQAYGSKQPIMLGGALGQLAIAGRDKLTLLASGSVEHFGIWAEQLIAESLGKDGKGILPVVGEPSDQIQDYGDDRVFVYLRVVDDIDSELDQRANKLRDAGHPLITIDVTSDAYDIGRLFLLFEAAIAIAGWVLEINPFDQPNVAQAKTNTNQALKGGVEDTYSTAEDVVAEIEELSEPSYVAILGYLPYRKEIDEAVERLRLAVLKQTGCATTFGYGPRYLHSTGQLHKGGPANGLFIQLLHGEPKDLDIPGANFSFGKLIKAQAWGDRQALLDHDSTVLRWNCSGDLVGSIDALTKIIKED